MFAQSNPGSSQGDVSTLTDGTVDARIVRAAEPFGGGYRLTVSLATDPSGKGGAGRYFLARCGATTVEERLANWQMYLRQVLFAGAVRRADGSSHEWNLLVPPLMTSGHGWLLGRPAGSTLNLIGPLGNGFVIAAHVRNLVLIGRDERSAVLLPLVDAMLDRGGRVTLLLIESQAGFLRRGLLPHLPIAAEVHMADNANWLTQVAELVPWADQVCGALPGADLAPLARALRQARLRFDPGFAFVLVDADLVCGYGACLACVVNTAMGGLTRACVHGPVFDLHRLIQV